MDKHFTVRTLNTILGTKVLGIRYPHRKTIRGADEINKHLPVGINGIINMPHSPKRTIVSDVFSRKETWKFVLMVSFDTCIVDEIISPDGKKWDTADVRKMYREIPSDVLRYSTVGQSLDYKDVLEFNKGRIENNVVTSEIDVRYVVYRQR